MEFEESGQTIAEFCRSKETSAEIETGRQKSAERKKLLHLMKKKAVKAVKKEANKDGKDEAEEEDVNIPQVSLLTLCTVTVKNCEQRHDSFSIILYSCQIFRFLNLRCRSRKNQRI